MWINCPASRVCTVTHSIHADQQLGPASLVWCLPGIYVVRHGALDPFCRSGADAGAGWTQVQNGFPADRVITRRGNLMILFDAATRMLKLNTTDVYPVVLGNGDNKTFTLYFPHPLPNAAVGDAVAVRPPACVPWRHLPSLHSPGFQAPPSQTRYLSEMLHRGGVHAWVISPSRHTAGNPTSGCYDNGNQGAPAMQTWCFSRCSVPHLWHAARYTRPSELCHSTTVWLLPGSPGTCSALACQCAAGITGCWAKGGKVHSNMAAAARRCRGCTRQACTCGSARTHWCPRWRCLAPAATPSWSGMASTTLVRLPP